MKIEIPFTGPAYASESQLVSAQECINLYPCPYPERGEGKLALFGTPGLELWSTLGTNAAIQATLVWGEYLYVVSGGSLHRVDLDGGAQILGGSGALGSTGPADMATNGLDIVIVLGATGFVWDMGGGGLSQITDVDFPGGDNVIQVDGYYLVNKPQSGQIHRSDYNTGASWGGLAFATAGGAADNVRALLVEGRDVVIFGEWTTEFWYNTGAATFNFARIEGAFLEQGIVSSFAKTKINNAIYHLGQDEQGRGQVFQTLGRRLQVVSTVPIDYQISKNLMHDALMFSYQQQGHPFVVVTFPLSNITWVYDSSVELWHQRSSLFNEVPGRWRINCAALYRGDHIVGDCLNGKLYKLKTDVYDENGTDMVATRTTPVIRSKQNRITVDEVEIVTEPGVGLVTGSAEDMDPQALFSWSRDGAKTWSPEIDLPLGKIGENTIQTRAWQLGQGINWVFKYKISAAVKRVILGATMEAEEDD